MPWQLDEVFLANFVGKRIFFQFVPRNCVFEHKERVQNAKRRSQETHSPNDTKFKEQKPNDAFAI